MPSNVVDCNSPTANMYGCEPCPQCGSRYRCVFQATPDVINCDDCGYKEPVAESANARAEEVVSIPKSLLQRICGMVYATRGEQSRCNFITDDEYGKLVSLRHSGHDSIETVLTALSGK